jgi:nitric oxide reductase NorD protein
VQPLLTIGRRLALKARFKAAAARERARAIAHARRPTVQLEDVHRRLELLIVALYGRPIPITPAETPQDAWTERARKFMSRDARMRETTAGADGESIRLPRALSARDGAEHAIARYRLLAIQQAERVTRGTPASAALRDALERDLYLLREGAAIDAAIARANPGMVGALLSERNATLLRRPKLDGLTRPEREVEVLMREILSSAPDALQQVASNPTESLAWAREKAADIRRGPGSYRGLPPASHWGTVHYAGAISNESGTLPQKAPPPWADVAPPAKPAKGHKVHSHNAQVAISADQRNASAGRMLSPDAPVRDVSDETDDAPDVDDGASSELSTRTNPDAPRAHVGNQGSVRGDRIPEQLDEETLALLPAGRSYDEWNANTGRYVKNAVTVRSDEPPLADPAWAAEVLQRHGALVRQVRRHFERLRARRTRLGRRRNGDELDIAACVDAIIDRHIGESPDDRLYVEARPARRGTAISLLVDVSGSTEARVHDELRIIDLERIALLLASEALDALGEPYAINAFAGRSAAMVKVTPVKSFAERNSIAVRGRVSALEAGGFTRLGAAVRHATWELAHQSAGHRLLLILSDGRPNDVDQYQGTYGVEDSRQAIIEARASGIFPFCLTVDRDASEYLPRIFGVAGHTILQRPEQLPKALLEAVRVLIGTA